MNGQESSHSTIIPWPAWDQPFHGTPRGYIATRETKWKPFVGLLGCLCFSVSLFALGPMEVVIAMPILLLAWVGVYFGKFLPMRRVVAEAREQFQPWRERWLRFEAESVAFQRDVRSGDCTLEEALNRAPTLPPVTWSVTRHVLKPLAEYAIAPDMPQNAQIELAQEKLARVLCEMARLAERCVVAKGQGLAAFGIYSLSDELQFWVRLTYSSEGMVLTPHLLMGIQRWARPFMDRTGYRYPGDVAKIKRADLKGLFIALGLVVPYLGWAIVCVPTFVRLRLFFETNNVVNLRDRLQPACGDSSDVFILQSEKLETLQGGDWTQLTAETEAAIEAMKGHVLNGVLRALSRRD